MGFMTLVNIPVILMLGKYAFAALKDYENQRKQGQVPTFKAKSIGITSDTDYWK